MLNDNGGLILMVDDNPDDYEATLRSLRKSHLDNPVHWCKSGMDAKNYLCGEGKYDSNPALPVLVLLDLNMPGLDGRQLLRDIKSDRKLCSIPIVILTTSNDPKDVEECYSLGACTYIQKPVDFDALTQAVQTIKDYWFDIALLPEYKD